MYHVNEGLGCVSAEITDHLNLILSRENILDQRDELIWRVVVAD